MSAFRSLWMRSLFVEFCHAADVSWMATGHKLWRSPKLKVLRTLGWELRTSVALHQKC